MTPPPQTDPTARSFPQRRANDLVIVGRRGGGLTDFYHRLLNLPPWGLLLVLAAVFLAANTVFAGLYMLDPGGVANAKPGSFADNFFFSVQTLGTVGYGVMTPKSVYANVVVTTEAFFSVVLVAVTTGIIFAKVSKPTARVMFSRVAVVSDHDGVPTLMFRAANQRANQILEAEVMLSLARQVTTQEGLTMRQFQTLRVTRSRTPLFALSWLIMHPLDEASPLHGVSPESLVAEGAELVVVLSGVDETFAQRIHARHSYHAQEILWEKQFEDILGFTDDGRRVINYHRFHDVRDPDRPASD
jgi:inward rectifier potassium channel